MLILFYAINGEALYCATTLARPVDRCSARYSVNAFHVHEINPLKRAIIPLRRRYAMNFGEGGHIHLKILIQSSQSERAVCAFLRFQPRKIHILSSDMLEQPYGARLTLQTSLVSMYGVGIMYSV